MSELRAGVVGLGMMGRHHVRALKELSGVELVAVHDEGLAADEFAGVRNTSSLQELIAMGVDYCVVAVPTGSHAEVGVTLADARVSALIEKPIAESVEEARSLCAAFDRAEVVGAVGHIERFNAAAGEALVKLDRRRPAGICLFCENVCSRESADLLLRVMKASVIERLMTIELALEGS